MCAAGGGEATSFLNQVPDENEDAAPMGLGYVV